MHISGFDLNMLLVLHALFEEGGVEAAAARIHLSRSATATSMQAAATLKSGRRTRAQVQITSVCRTGTVFMGA
jgi:hypothetical protein